AGAGDFFRATKPAPSSEAWVLAEPAAASLLSKEGSTDGGKTAFPNQPTGPDFDARRISLVGNRPCDSGGGTAKRRQNAAANCRRAFRSRANRGSSRRAQ